MSSPRRAELAERIMNLRESVAASRNDQDRYALLAQVRRLEDELARLQPEPHAPPVEHSGGPEAVGPPFREPER